MIVRDSSLWQDQSSQSVSIPGSIRTGIVIDRGEDKDIGTIIYLVEVDAYGHRYVLTCQQMGKFGHPYNYEQYSYKPIESLGQTKLPEVPSSFGVRSGDTVVVAELPGNEGIILGGLKHPQAKNQLTADEDSYISSYNGLKTEIKADGSYKTTFNGPLLPQVKAQLKLPIMTPALPDITAYNHLIAGSFFGFAKDGSYEVSDSSTVGLPQGIKIDKTGGTLTITSGLLKIAMDKKTSKLTIDCIDASISAKKSFKVDSAQVEIAGLTGVKIKGAKIAIGFGGVELIDSIVKLIDAIGLLVIPHPLGPCSPISAAPTWALQVELIKAKLTLIKGSL
jgi:hypothetical protein